MDRCGEPASNRFGELGDALWNLYPADRQVISPVQITGRCVLRIRWGQIQPVSDARRISSGIGTEHVQQPGLRRSQYIKADQDSPFAGEPRQKSKHGKKNGMSFSAVLIQRRICQS